jgi:phosphohistidine swiveling domain-containing protein
MNRDPGFIPAGHGTMVSGGSAAVTGRFVALLEVSDLLEVMDRDDGPFIAYMTYPNVTMIAPAYDVMSGIVCEHGDAVSHVAIVAREIDVPCAVQTRLEIPLEQLRGREVRLSASGQLEVWDEGTP